MTTTNRLALIRARCVELLAIAEKRTPGEWQFANIDDYMSMNAYLIHTGCEPYIAGDDIENVVALTLLQSPSVCGHQAGNWFEDAYYIAACAGAAEAAWKATISAIDVCLEGLCYHSDMTREIIAAWECQI